MNLFCIYHLLLVLSITTVLLFIYWLCDAVFTELICDLHCVWYLAARFVVAAVHPLAPHLLLAWGQSNPQATSNYITDTSWWTLMLCHCLLVPLGGHTAHSTAAWSVWDYTHNQADYHTHLLYAWQHVLGRKWWYSWSIETIVQNNEMILIQDLGLHQPPTLLTTTWSRNGTDTMTKWEWKNTALCVETPHNIHGDTWQPSQNT